MTLIAGIGDSLMVDARSGAWAYGEGYLARVAAKIGAEWLSFAVSGAKTTEMDGQWEDAAEAAPDLLIACLGENDIPGATAGTSVANFAAALDAQVWGWKQTGIPLVLLTPFIYDNSTYLAAAPDYVQAILSIGVKYSVPVVDEYSALCAIRAGNSTLYNSLVISDGHATVAGQQWRADRFDLPQFKRLLPCAPVPALTGLVWSAMDKIGAWNLSGDGLTAACGVSDCGIRSTVSVDASGDHFIKVRKNSGGNNVVIGVAKSDASLTFPGLDAKAWMFRCYNGQKFANGNFQSCGSAMADGGTLYIRLKSGGLWFGTSSGWIGNPEAGTGAAYTGLTGNLFLTAGTTNASPTTNVTIDRSDDAMRGSASLW